MSYRQHSTVVMLLAFARCSCLRHAVHFRHRNPWRSLVHLLLPCHL